jgi:phospholipid transport system transporter-binding protein
MLRVEDGVALLEGDLNLANASQWLEQGEAALKAGVTVFDLAGIGHIDSAALSLMLSLRRRAQAAGTRIAFHNTPGSLASLADLYGVTEQI